VHHRDDPRRVQLRNTNRRHVGKCVYVCHRDDAVGHSIRSSGVTELTLRLEFREITGLVSNLFTHNVTELTIKVYY
jgi:hypothetical protein